MNDVTWDQREWTLICPKCHGGYYSKMIQCYRTLGGLTKRKGLAGQYISDTVTVTPGAAVGEKPPIDEKMPITVQYPRVHISPEKSVCEACSSGKKKRKGMNL